MKTIVAILSSAFVIIAICMLILVKTGVSLRTAPIIKQSLLADDELNITTGIVLRLYPDFQQAEVVIWNIDQNSALVQKNLGLLKNRLEKEFKKSITVLYNGEEIQKTDIEICPKPCWIYFKPDSVHEFSKNSWIESLKSITPHFFTISWNSFMRDMPFTDECLQEQRLTLECVKEVSVNEVRRKLKKEGRYFFMRKYLDYDYFLFVEAE